MANKKSPKNVLVGEGSLGCCKTVYGQWSSFGREALQLSFGGGRSEKYEKVARIKDFC